MCGGFILKTHQSIPMSTALFASKLNHSKHRFVLRFSSKPDTNLRRRPQYDESLVTQSLELLQPPQNEWKLDQLRRLLFSGSPPSPLTFFHITRRLPSSDKAFHFLQCLETNTDSLSSSFQAVLEIASRERDSTPKLLQLFKLSKERNIPLTSNAATILLPCFRRAGMTDDSLCVFEYLHPSLRNTDVRNALIEALLQWGRVADALKVLDEMLQRDAKFPPNKVTWSIVSKLLFFSGEVVSEDKTVELVLKFSDHRVFPAPKLLSILITKLCRGGKTDKAWDLFHHVVVKMGGCAETNCCNALLTGLGRIEDLDRMNALLAEMKELEIQPDVITFGILINLLCKWRMIDSALELLEKLINGEEGVSAKPDLFMYNTVIDVLCTARRHEEAFTLVKRMRLESGYEPNDFTYNSLMDGCCKAGEIDRALEILHQAKSEGFKPCEFTINTFVSGMCWHGKLNSAVEFIDQMQRKGVKCAMRTYSTLIRCYFHANNIDKGMELFDRVLSEGHSPNATMYYSMIAGLCLAGRMDDAMVMVSKLKRAGFCLDSQCFNVLISSFCKHEMLDKANEVLKEMEDAKVKPTCATYNSLISYFGKAGNLSAAHGVWKEMINAGVQPDEVTYGTLINAYCLDGKLDEAMQIFNSMRSASKVPPGVVIYSILIRSLCKNGKEKHAFSLMNDMRVKGVRPNINTYNFMFRGLQRKNMLEEAFELMDRMVEEDCKPDCATIETLIEWLPIVGEMEKLKRFMQVGMVSSSA